MKKLQDGFVPGMAKDTEGTGKLDIKDFENLDQDSLQGKFGKKTVDIRRTNRENYFGEETNAKYEEHYNEINNKTIDGRIEEFKQYINEKLKESNNSFVSENGEVEKWVGGLDADKVEEYTNQAIQLLEGMKTKT